MTTQPAPVPEGYISPDTLPPEDRAYVERLERALRCGIPGCSCADPGRFHCPSHDNAEVPTLRLTRGPRGLSFECTRCPFEKVLDALARRGLMPRAHLYNSAGAHEAGLQPLNLLIQQPPDWLWPNRIPLGKLTLIAGYPSSGKTSIALDIAARVSRGASAPDQPHALFPFAPVVLALFDGNPKSDVLPTLRLFGADLDCIYLADLLSPTHPIDYYPGDPPDDDDEEEDRNWGAKDWDDEDDEDEEEEEYRFDNDGNEIRVPRRPVGIRVPPPLPWKPPNAAADFTAPWPSLSKVMKRLANLIEAGSAALLIVDQVEDLAAMHRANVTTVLGMLKALAARSGAAIVALTHNPAPNYPRAVSAMQRRLPQASVVFTTALVEPGNRRFLIPLRPPMSDDAPAIPFVLPPLPSLLRRQEPRIPTGRSPVIPAKAGIQSGPEGSFRVAWRKPVFPAHMSALADPNRDHGAKIRAAQAFLVRALAGGSRPALAIEREATLLGISKGTLRRARLACNVICTRVSEPGVRGGPGAWYWSLPRQTPVDRNEPE
ncbi:MAG: AAA family ATPase [Chloroflexota bacterium]|nr:AAA family ATPase [Chloroflexota bacterium]MDE2886296.1 AAA family ATPase [Chloroflexota bacterium]